MKKMKTRQFLKTFYAVLGLSAGFLLWMLVFGRGVAVQCFDGVLGCVCGVFALASVSLMIFCFVPYFRGDKRWLAIPSLLTLVFFAGSAMLWQVPVGGLAV